MKVGVIGAGAWGTALSIVSYNGGNNVTMWSFDAVPPAGAPRFSPYLDNIEIPGDIKITQNMADLRDMEIWLMVVPAAFFRETIRLAREFWNNQPIIICTKGMEPNTHKFMSEIIFEEMSMITDAGLVGVLSGPQFAIDVAHNIPTGSTLAGAPVAFDAGKVALSGLYLEPSDDIIGAQICGVGKNAIAMMMGYLDGRGAGENERAMKLTLAWGEIVALGREMGAKTETFLKLCGLGDLYLTATSRTSRNFSAGRSIALGQDIGNKTVEGIFALRGLMMRADKYGIRMPILAEFNKIISY